MKTITTAALAVALVSAAAWAREPTGQYADDPTSEWFKSLSSPFEHDCCDQADCAKAESDYHDGSWWAVSNRTHAWVRIEDDRLTGGVSVFKDAVLCEGDPVAVDMNGAPAGETPRVYCFTPPPLGF